MQVDLLNPKKKKKKKKNYETKADLYGKAKIQTFTTRNGQPVFQTIDIHHLQQIATNISNIKLCLTNIFNKLTQRLIYKFSIMPISYLTPFPTGDHIYPTPPLSQDMIQSQFF